MRTETAAKGRCLRALKANKSVEILRPLKLRLGAVQEVRRTGQSGNI